MLKGDKAKESKERISSGDALKLVSIVLSEDNFYFKLVARQILKDDFEKMTTDTETAKFLLNELFCVFKGGSGIDGFISDSDTQEFFDANYDVIMEFVRVQAGLEHYDNVFEFLGRSLDADFSNYKQKIAWAFLKDVACEAMWAIGR